MQQESATARHWRPFMDAEPPMVPKRWLLRLILSADGLAITVLDYLSYRRLS